jgi:polysaccharide biosynthesis transport protein
VKPVGGTRLIEIHYESPDPKLAAAVVNRLTRALIDYTFQTRFEATNQTSQWLREQLGDLRKDSEDLQAKVVDLERQSGVYGLDTTDTQGQQQSYSDVVSRLQLATTAMTLAEQNRILKGAIARAADSGDPELISGLAGNSMAGTAMGSSLTLVQTLRAQETAAQASLDQAEEKYGPAYSRISELKGQVSGIQRSIKAEISRVRARAESDSQVAIETEAGARSKYRGIKAEADKLNDKAIEYAIAKQDAVESRSLYEDLVKRLKEAGVLESLKSSNLTVVDPGRIPAVPKKPNVPLTMLLALGGGLVIGCSAAFLYHSLDRTVHTIADLEAATGVGVMAALPLVDLQTLEKGRVILQSLPQSPFSEAIRTARTAILLSKRDRPPKTILVTSSLPREGKSLFSVNLAAALARQGRRVLVVDVDLRRGTLSRRFNLSPEGGLSTVLSGMTTELVIHRPAELGELSIIGPGPVPPDPSELLGSDTFLRYLSQWREEYDFVVLDSAPVLPVTDSVSVSRLVDTTILLARAGLVRREQVRRCYSLLAHGDAHNLGIILNGMSSSDSSYYDYYGYYGRSGDVYPLHGEELCANHV